MGSTLIEANFQNANLMEANFTSANISNVNFEGANLIGANWTDGEKCGAGSIENVNNVKLNKHDVFNFLTTDEKDDDKCVKLGKDWITAMETNLDNMELQLEEADKIKHKEDIKNNRDHLNSLKNKSSSEWREYATQCMIEIMENVKFMSNQEKFFIMICISLIIFTLYYLIEKHLI